jgi:GNAT superfamily N-acetyltransferase
MATPDDRRRPRSVRAPVTLDLVRWGGDRLRVGPWRGDARVAYVAPVPDGPPPTAAGVRHCLDVLASRGYVGAVTSALSTPETHGFITAGFAVRERLHLLVHPLADLPPVPASDSTLRRGRRTDRRAALDVDHAAFPLFWQLDEAGFEEAVAATPAARFRVAVADHAVGYAITGRAAKRGYVQRLAVVPAYQGRGVGGALLIDGLRWMRRWGARHAVVNTQESNTAALGLYEKLGFRRQPAGLAVLETALA